MDAEQLGTHEAVEQRHIDAAMELAREYSPAAAEAQPGVIRELAEAEAGVQAVMKPNFPERPR